MLIKKASYQTLGNILLFAALVVATINFIQPFSLILVQSFFSDIRWGSVVLAILLFSPASIVLGMVPTYAVRLKLEDIKNSGEMVGRLYALSTVGSIAGTFLAGFFLIAFFGSSKILIFLSIALVAASLVAFVSKVDYMIFIVVFAVSSYVVTSNINPYSYAIEIVDDMDSAYSRIIVAQMRDKKNNRPILFLNTGRLFYITAYQSAVYADGEHEPFGEYLKFFELANHFNPNIKRALMLGGGANSFIKVFINSNPKASIDVVEIDPKLSELAMEYFYFTESDSIRIYNMDARRYLNNTKEKYDVIYLDAFNDITVPHHLTTQEMMETIDNHLNEDGLLVMNVISAVDGDSGLIFQAQYKTIEQVFPYTLAFPVEDAGDQERIQNIIIIASKSNIHNLVNINEGEYAKEMMHLRKERIADDVLIFTDDHAPVEYYFTKMSPQLFKISRNI